MNAKKPFKVFKSDNAIQGMIPLKIAFKAALLFLGPEMGHRGGMQVFHP